MLLSLNPKMILPSSTWASVNFQLRLGLVCKLESEAVEHLGWVITETRLPSEVKNQVKNLYFDKYPSDEQWTTIDDMYLNRDMSIITPIEYDPSIKNNTSGYAEYKTRKTMKRYNHSLNEQRSMFFHRRDLCFYHRNYGKFAKRCCINEFGRACKYYVKPRKNVKKAVQENNNALSESEPESKTMIGKETPYDYSPVTGWAPDVRALSESEAENYAEFLKKSHPEPDDLIPAYRAPVGAWATSVIEVLFMKGIVDLSEDYLLKDILRVIITRIPGDVFEALPKNLNVEETLKWLINYDHEYHGLMSILLAEKSIIVKPSISWGILKQQLRYGMECPNEDNWIEHLGWVVVEARLPIDVKNRVKIMSIDKHPTVEQWIVIDDMYLNCENPIVAVVEGSASFDNTNYEHYRLQKNKSESIVKNKQHNWHNLRREQRISYKNRLDMCYFHRNFGDLARKCKTNASGTACVFDNLHGQGKE